MYKIILSLVLFFVGTLPTNAVALLIDNLNGTIIIG